MRKLLLPVLLGTLGACGGGAPTETPVPSVTPGLRSGVFLHNAMPEPLAYVAAGEGTLALLDIRPTLRQGEYEHRLVEPGTRVEVTDIIGYQQGLGVGFFIYLVDPGSREARFTGHFLAAARELDLNDGVVTVTRSRL